MPSETGVLKKSLIAGLAIVAAASLGACASNREPRTFEGREPAGFNPLGVFDGGSRPQGDRPAISVNGYLWRAALDNSRLRADGLNVALFRQVRDPSGAWTDAQVNAQTEIDLENAILTRARQVRLSDVPG